MRVSSFTCCRKLANTSAVLQGMRCCSHSARVQDAGSAALLTINSAPPQASAAAVGAAVGELPRVVVAERDAAACAECAVCMDSECRFRCGGWEWEHQEYPPLCILQFAAFMCLCQRQGF